MTEKNLTDKVFTLEVEATGPMSKEYPALEFNPEHWEVFLSGPHLHLAPEVEVNAARNAMFPTEGGNEPKLGGYCEIFVKDRQMFYSPLLNLPLQENALGRQVQEKLRDDSLQREMEPCKSPLHLLKMNPGDIVRLSMRTADDQDVQGMYFGCTLNLKLRDGVTPEEARCGAIPLAVSEYAKHPAYALGREAFARSEPVTKVMGVEDPLAAFAWACGWHDARFEAFKGFDDTAKLTLIKEIVNCWRWDDVKKNPVIQELLERD